MAAGATYIVVAVVAYLCGSIPFGYLLVRGFRGSDIRLTGSGNIGATNVARSGAKGLAVFTLLFDVLKGFAAVLIAEMITSGPNSALYNGRTYAVGAFAALFAIIGHMFPVWLRFHGGKGVATGVGAFFALAPLQVAIAVAIFVVVVALTRYVSLGSILATAAFPILVWFWRFQHPFVFLPLAVAAVLIIARHGSNIRRLLAGTEHRFGAKVQ
jgi:acyl phosphate:glycerol-3-phosphate acyltransferase